MKSLISKGIKKTNLIFLFKLLNLKFYTFRSARPYKQQEGIALIFDFYGKLGRVINSQDY